MDKDTLFSSFGKWLEPICFKTFKDHIAETQQDKYVKKLTTPAYLKLFLHAQLQQRDGLREIADDVLSEEFQKELGLESISAAQLSRKHNQVESRLLEQIFANLVTRILKEASTTKYRNDFKIIDSTTIGLCLQKYKWAVFRKTKAGIKIHLRLVFVGEHDVVPEKAVMTPAKKNDRTQMDALIDEAGATYIFDRGYVDYAAFDRYCDSSVFFVSRLKKNAVIRPIHAFKLPVESKVVSDQMVYVGTPQKRMENVVRLVHTTDSEGNLLAIVTNRFDLEADEIGDMYRKRWAIETFFKWMKQHIRIQSFYGTSQQAVMNQVWIALIAFCLLVFVKQETGTTHTLLTLYRWLKALLWKPSSKWLDQILRQPSRTSQGRKKRF